MFDPKKPPALPEGDPQLNALVDHLHPDLLQLLFEHRIPSEDAVPLLKEVLSRIVVHWHAIDDKITFLLEAVDAECLTYWQARGLRSPALSRRADPSPPSFPLEEPAGGAVDFNHLRALLPLDRQRTVFARSGRLSDLRLAISTVAP